MIPVVIEEVQGYVGTHRRDPNQSILIGGGIGGGRRAGEESRNQLCRTPGAGLQMPAVGNFPDQ